ncbi:MAG: carbamoyl-phosphate synthase small subunit, partial [Firmicutes bacterium]|nr:carbamoyl-phosphate synthase small subunit [Bacillota bacterium]
LIALAEGAETFRLQFGHHGANHPVKDEVSGRVIMTSQNHGYSVNADNLRDRYAVRMVNGHDYTVEGLQHKNLPVMTVQFHPEASPGPFDARYLFDEFLRQVIDRKGENVHA